MNKLQKDLKLRAYAWVVNRVCFVMLGLMALLNFLLGLEEQEFYAKYPAGWWVVVALGLAFIGSLIYAVKKAYDVHPNIQLRSKPDDVLEEALADPEYEMWHHEARTLLHSRQTSGGNRKPEVPRWIAWPLVGFMYTLLALISLALIAAFVVELFDK